MLAKLAWFHKKKKCTQNALELLLQTSGIRIFSSGRTPNPPEQSRYPSLHYLCFLQSGNTYDIVLLHLSTISIWIINFDSVNSKEKSAWQMLIYHHSEWNLTAFNFLLAAWLKWHGFRPVSFTMPYSKLYILTQLRGNALKFISVDRQKLVLSKYGTIKSIFVEIQPISMNKKWPSYLDNYLNHE